MALVVTPNQASLNASGRLGGTAGQSNATFGRLSSGLSINRAPDEAPHVGVDGPPEAPVPRAQALRALESAGSATALRLGADGEGGPAAAARARAEEAYTRQGVNARTVTLPPDAPAGLDRNPPDAAALLNGLPSAPRGIDKAAGVVSPGRSSIRDADFADETAVFDRTKDLFRATPPLSNAAPKTQGALDLLA